MAVSMCGEACGLSNLEIRHPPPSCPCLHFLSVSGHRRKGAVREAPFYLSPPLFGHCPNSNYTPPPHSNGHSGHFFSGAILPFFTIFTIFYPFYHFFTIFSLNKCPKPSGQGFRPPQNQANAPLNLENSSLKKCPKPSGQGFRPPPQMDNAQIKRAPFLKVLP